MPRKSYSRNPRSNHSGRSDRGSKKKAQKNSIKIPYLGKVALFWCTNCNTPILDSFNCPTCKTKPDRVSLSPPGDVRPAFHGDIVLYRETLNNLYGTGIGDLIFPENKPILANRIGGLDRTEEIILDGNVLGVFRFSPVGSKYEFLPRAIGGIYIHEAMKILKMSPTKRILSNSDGLPFILDGKSILAPGVLSISEDLCEGDYALITTKDEIGAEEFVIAIGIVKSNYTQLQHFLATNHGMLAKNKDNLKKLSIDLHHQIHSLLSSPSQTNDIREIYSKTFYNNQAFIDKQVSEAVHFIQETVSKTNHPVAVAYSGGKDSLATLILVWKALKTPFKIFFADTGLELPEVLENVKAVTKILGKEDDLIIKSAGNRFWEIVKDFGPPGRDYRFCCHSLKAQQIMDIITTIYDGQKVLTFLGQRQYESLTRANSDRIYVNSFIPLQLAAAPIQKWNSLLLWLLLLYHEITLFNGKVTKLPITSLYFEGNERLGCYLCPASNLSTFKILEKSHPKLHHQWFDFLKKYADEYQLPKEWISWGLWRFKRLNPQWINLLDENSISLQYLKKTQHLSLNVTKGFSPCVNSGYSLKAKFNTGLDLDYLSILLQSLSIKIEYDEEINTVSIQGEFMKKFYHLNFFPDGSLYLLTQSSDFEYQKFIRLITTLVLKLDNCSECGTCVSVCNIDALKLEDHKLTINSEKCMKCMKCITHCPLYTSADQITKMD